MTPEYVRLVILSVLHQTRRENPLVHKRLINRILISTHVRSSMLAKRLVFVSGVMMVSLVMPVKT